MKNDTKTHAANPADNAAYRTAFLEWCERHDLDPAEIESQSAFHDAFFSQENIDTIARLKRERDELLAMLKRVQEIFECGEDLSNINFFGTEQNQIRALIARIEKGGAS